MSGGYDIHGEIQPPKYTALTGTGETDIHVPTGKGRYCVVEIALANNTSNPCEITLRWNDGSSSYIFWHVDVPADDSKSCYLPIRYGASASAEPAQKLTAQAEAGNAVFVTVVSALLSPRPAA